MLKKEIRGLKKATIKIGTTMTKYLRNIQNIPTSTSNFKTMTDLFDGRFNGARANGDAFSL
jgi:hypothetical protein